MKALLVGDDRVPTIVIQWDRIPRSVGGSRRLLLAQFAPNIRPELLYHVGDGVISHLRAPNAGGVGQSAVGAGMVAVGGNGSCGRTAENLREIKLLMP